MTLGGNICIRNGNELDYCWRECIESLLPVCDLISVCDGQSTDGTQEEIRAWQEKEPKIVLCVYPWPNPQGDSDFWVNWLNYGREHVRADLHLQLDADEVLHENSYETIQKIKDISDRASYVFDRYNFWRDTSHLVPHGVNLGHRVVRLAPQNVWLPSDGYHPTGAECMMMVRDAPGRLEIMHYGFLRKPDAFFKKARALQGYFFNTYDQRLADAETHPKWMEKPGITGWEGNLLDFNGTHPERMRGWLEQRGYQWAAAVA